MDCKTIHTDLIFYLDNELPIERRTIVQKHLNECMECREFLALLQSEMQIIGQEKNPEVSAYFFTRLSAQLDKETELQTQSMWVRMAQPAFFSLLLIIGIYGGMQLGNYADSTTTKHETSSILQLNDFETEPIESFLLDKL